MKRIIAAVGVAALLLALVGVPGYAESTVAVAGTGQSIHSGTVTVDTTLSGSTYSMIDPIRGNRTCEMVGSTCPTMLDADNIWGTGTTAHRQSVAADAHYVAAKTFDYFKYVHGRNGIFGTGAGIVSRVHYGSNYPYAVWYEGTMTYGDGPLNGKPPVPLDVAAHEMTYGVTEYTADLGTTGEPGALRLATSDIFATMIEFYANNAVDPGDYKVGDRLGTTADGWPVRHMYDPTQGEAPPGCWSTATKGMDVHYSAGVGDHFFFNLAEGSGATAYGTSPVCGSAPAVTGIGRAKAERIWFRALDVYFAPNTTYVNPTNPNNSSRAATLHAAADFYGLCGVEYKAVQAAWTSVNVAGNDAPCPSGNNFALAVSPSSGSVLPAGTLTTTISSTLLSGAAEQVTLSVSGAPAGVLATLNPSIITSDDGTSTLTMAVGAATAPGTYPLTITGASTVPNRIVTYLLIVGSIDSCVRTNPADVPIADLSTVESAIVVTGCPGYAGGQSKVEVHILHTYIGDLTVTLFAPDNSPYVLHNRTGGGTDNIHQTYTLNLATKLADGPWRLRVQDSATGDIGNIDSWIITLKP